jgi:hypothetical protein
MSNTGYSSIPGLKFSGALKVGALMYSVYTGEPEGHPELDPLDGELNYTLQQIFIRNNPGINLEYALSTLFHEITHALFHHAALDNKNEALVSAFAHALHAFFVDNPGLIDLPSLSSIAMSQPGMKIDPGRVIPTIDPSTEI